MGGCFGRVGWILNVGCVFFGWVVLWVGKLVVVGIVLKFGFVVCEVYVVVLSIDMNEWKVIWFVGIVGSFVGGVIGVKVGVMIGVFGGLIGLVVVGVIGGVFGMFVGDKVLSVVVSKFLGWKVDEMFVNVEVVVKVVKVVESLVVDVWFGLCID